MIRTTTIGRSLPLLFTLLGIATAVADERAEAPMLPDKPFDYMRVPLPDYIYRQALAAADNTPQDNPLSNAGATLGRVLFYDRKLSRNNSIACASCHLQRAAFSDPRRFSTGFKGGKTTRNAMSLANARYTHLKGHRPGFFWDERAPSLEAQALMPIQDSVEMGMTLPDLEHKLSRLTYYPHLFQAAFGTPQVTSERVGKGLAQFVRSLVSFNARFDHAAALMEDGHLNKPIESFTALENLGKSLFLNGVGGIAEFGCAMCHLPPTFNMQKAQNIGLDQQYADPGLGALTRPSNDPFTPSNDGKFKAPSLRNIALTAPYMHDGRFTTLAAVVKHYSDDVRPHDNLALGSPSTDSTGFQLSSREQAALVAFLKTLTDETFVTDPRFADPFVQPIP